MKANFTRNDNQFLKAMKISGLSSSDVSASSKFGPSPASLADEARETRAAEMRTAIACGMWREEEERAELAEQRADMAEARAAKWRRNAFFWCSLSIALSISLVAFLLWWCLS